MDLKGSGHGLTEILSLHLTEGKKDQLSLPPASARFSLGLNFNPEDGDNIFLRNVGMIKTVHCTLKQTWLIRITEMIMLRTKRLKNCGSIPGM
jgi:hypothetical protein